MCIRDSRKDQSFLEALDHLVVLHLLEVHQEVLEDLADLLHRRCLMLALLARYLLLVQDHQVAPEALEDQVGPVGLLCRLTPVGLEVLELLEVQQSLAALEDQVGLWDQDHLQVLWSLGTEELSLLYHPQVLLAPEDPGDPEDLEVLHCLLFLLANCQKCSPHRHREQSKEILLDLFHRYHLLQSQFPLLGNERYLPS